MNKNEIIGYKDYYYDKHEYSRIGPPPRWNIT